MIGEGNQLDHTTCEGDLSTEMFAGQSYVSKRKKNAFQILEDISSIWGTMIALPEDYL